MKMAVCCFFLFVSSCLYADKEPPRLPAAIAWNMLMDGNKRYVADEMQKANRLQERRLATFAKQKPFAIVLGCSDSRVPAEIIFDQGIGDIFVVRVAGNVLGDTELDSIEYAALYLNASLVLVLGHEGCGAVQAVMEGQTKEIEAVAKRIKAAIDPLMRKKDAPFTLEQAVKENVRSIVNQLKKTRIIQKLVRDDGFGVFGAYYELDSGKVERLL